MFVLPGIQQKRERPLHGKLKLGSQELEVSWTELSCALRIFCSTESYTEISDLGIFFTWDQPCFVSTRLHFPYSFLFVCFGLWKSQLGLLWCVVGIWGLLGWAPLWWWPTQHPGPVGVMETWQGKASDRSELISHWLGDVLAIPSYWGSGPQTNWPKILVDTFRLALRWPELPGRLMVWLLHC